MLILETPGGDFSLSGHSLSRTGRKVREGREGLFGTEGDRPGTSTKISVRISNPSYVLHSNPGSSSLLNLGVNECRSYSVRKS